MYIKISSIHSAFLQVRKMISLKRKRRLPWIEIGFRPGELSLAFSSSTPSMADSLRLCLWSIPSLATSSASSDILARSWSRSSSRVSIWARIRRHSASATWPRLIFSLAVASCSSSRDLVSCRTWLSSFSSCTVTNTQQWVQSLFLWWHQGEDMQAWHIYESN